MSQASTALESAHPNRVGPGSGDLILMEIRSGVERTEVLV
jgi:hypothetical protein